MSCASADDDSDFDLEALLADLEAPALEGEPRYYQEAAGGEFEVVLAPSRGSVHKPTAPALRYHWPSSGCMSLQLPLCVLLVGRCRCFFWKRQRCF